MTVIGKERAPPNSAPDARTPTVCRRESTPWRPARHPRHLDTFSTFPHYADPDREYMLPEDYEFVNFFMKKPATVPITVPWRPTSKPKRVRRVPRPTHQTITWRDVPNSV